MVNGVATPRRWAASTVAGILLTGSSLGAQVATPDPRALALVGATTTLAEGIHAVGYNPALLGFAPTRLSMTLFGINVGFENDFLSVSTWNRFNGADFIDSAAANYVDSDELFDGLGDDGLRVKSRLHLPWPGISFQSGTMAFSSDLIVFGDMGVPQSLFQMLFRGNELGQELDLSLNEEIMAVNEWSFSFALPMSSSAVGFTFKYLQGLFYAGVDPDSSSGNFVTDSTGFRGEGRYLIRRVIGGGGVGLDIGFATQAINGYRFGAALINAVGSIQWGGPSITESLMGAPLRDRLGWRKGEYEVHTYKINVTGLDLLQGVPQDSLFTTETYKVVDLPDSGLVRSDGLTNEELAELPAPALFVTNYPTLFRVGISKELEGIGLLAVDLVTGFEDRLWSFRRWHLAAAMEIRRVPALPIRMGLRFGGEDFTQLGFGVGFHTKILQLDFGVSLQNGLWLHTTKGLNFSLGVTLLR